MPRPPPPDAAPVRLAGLLALAIMVGTINGVSRVAMPLFAAALGGQPWQIGIVGGLGYAGVMLLSMPLGAWIDRYGSRVLFTRGVLVSAALYLLLPLVHRPGMLVLATALLGLALPFRTVPAQTEFLALLPQLPPSKAGWNRAAFILGMFFVGPGLAAAVIAGAGFTGVFLLATAGLLAAFLVGQRALPAGRVDAAPAAGDGLLPRLRAQLAMLAGHAAMRRTMAIDFLTQMAVAYFVVFSVILAVRRFELPLQAAAGLITLQGAVYVVTLFAGGAWLAIRHEDRHYLLAFALLGAQGLLFGFGPGPWALWLGAGLMGLGVGLQGLTSTTRFAELMREHGRGKVGGVTAVAPTAGGVIGAIGGGVLSQHLGTEAGFVLLGLVYALLCVVQGWRLWRGRTDGRQATG